MSLDAPVRMFLAAITGSAADGDRWKYSWAEVYQETAGYEGFTATTTRPRISSAYSPERYARNLAEQSASWTGLPVSAGTVVPMLGVECVQDAEFWFYVPGAAALDDWLLNCCSQEFLAVIDGATSGSDKTQTDADVDYPLVTQAAWNALRLATFALLTDTNGTPSAFVTGGLGRYGYYSSVMIDIDTISITCNASLANNLEFHVDTSSIGNKPIQRAVLYIYTNPPGTGTGPGPEDYGQTFEFSVCRGNGWAIRAEIDANTPDRITSGGQYAYKVEIDPAWIVPAGDTEFKFTYDSPIGADPDVWPFNEAPDEEYVNGWMVAPTVKLLVLYDAYIPDLT